MFLRETLNVVREPRPTELERGQRHALDDPGLDPVDVQCQRLIRGFEERVRTICESDLKVSWALS